MENKVVTLRRMYKSFRKGEEDPLAVKSEAMLVFKDVEVRGDRKIIEEVEDMLIDLEFSIEENKCKCHRERSSC